MQSKIETLFDREFLVVVFLLCLFIALWGIDVLFHDRIQAARWRAEFKRLAEEEAYFRALRDGKVKPRHKRDVWRCSYADPLEFEQFLTSLWRNSEYWYPRRQAALNAFEDRYRFIVHRDGDHSPTGEKMDWIEFRH